MAMTPYRIPQLPRRGRVRNRVYKETLWHIEHFTDIIAGESAQLRGSEDEVQAIENDLIEWQNALTVAGEMEGSSNEDPMMEMRQLAGRAEGILNAFITRRKMQTERTCFMKFALFFDDLIAQHRFKKEITVIGDSIRREILEVQQQKPNSGRLQSVQTTSSNSTRETKPVRVDQFDDKIIRSRLTNVSGAGKGRSVISIVGREGVGKTTLARRIYEDSVIAQAFPIRAWVTVSDESVLMSIIEQVRREPAERTWTGREIVETLSGLLSCERYLIVLDGVDTNEVLDGLQLQAAFPDMSNGSRIMITTRNKDVALHEASSTIPLELQPLSDEAGWEFFKTKVQYQVPDGLETIGKSIVRRCMGLPGKISDIGATLSRREATEDSSVTEDGQGKSEASRQWKRELEQLKQDQASRYEALYEVANSLSSNLKQCLFYFGLFKEDYNIPARRLVVLWVAEGLFRQGKNKKESAESIAEKQLENLVEQDMVQVIKQRPDGRVKTCRMHIGLRDLWKSKAEKAHFFHSCSSTTDSSAISIRRLADHLDKEHVCFSHIHGNHKANSSDFQSHYQSFYTFVSFDTRAGDMPGDDIGRFLHEGISRRCFKGLCVLDLERVFRPKLPESIGKLIHLRYLGLRWTYLERLPTSINNLLNLQILDLKNTYISVIPSSLWHMRQLRHLYLSESYRSRFVIPKGASSLQYLQTLWGAFVNDEISVDGLHGFKNLRKLGLVFQLGPSQQRLLARRILNMKDLESLRLVSIDESIKPSSIHFDSLLDLEKLSSLYLLGKLETTGNICIVNNLPGSLTDITLSLSQLDKDPMEELGELPNLKILKLFGNAYTKQVMRCHPGSFRVLQVLKLWKQESLEDWSIYEGSLQVLEELEIRSCKNLKEMPQGIEHLLMLQNLTLTDMPETFTARVKENQGADWDKIAHVPWLNIIPDVTQDN